MKKCFSLLVAISCLAALQANALVFCTISDFELETHDNGLSYFHATVGGTFRTFLKPCTYVSGQSSGAQDCTSAGSQARISTILTAFGMGKDLQLGFEKDNLGNTIGSCSAVTNYSHPVSIRIKR